MAGITDEKPRVIFASTAREVQLWHETERLKATIARMEAQIKADDKTIRAFYADHPEWIRSASARSVAKMRQEERTVTA
jgi:hypothetical protein